MTLWTALASVQSGPQSEYTSNVGIEDSVQLAYHWARNMKYPNMQKGSQDTSIDESRNDTNSQEEAQCLTTACMASYGQVLIPFPSSSCIALWHSEYKLGKILQISSRRVRYRQTVVANKTMIYINEMLMTYCA